MEASGAGGVRAAMKKCAVSEIIGTLVLVGVVVVGIALVGIFLLSNPTPSKVPAFNALISNESKAIYIYHKGGDSVRMGEIHILVDGVDRTSSFVNNGDDPWSVGETHLPHHAPEGGNPLHWRWQGGSIRPHGVRSATRFECAPPLTPRASCGLGQISIFWEHHHPLPVHRHLLRPPEHYLLLELQ